MKTIVICSGGLDSVSLAHRIAAEQQLIGLLSFDYGQRHRKELDFATACAKRLGVPHQIIDIRTIGRHLTGSALTDDIDVPDGHYAEETMKATVVPNRNAIMLAIAFGLAAAQKADAVAVAVHGGDHFIYPDCRPGFIDAFQAMQDAGAGRLCRRRAATRPTSTARRRISSRTGEARHAVCEDMVLLQGRRAPLRALRHLRRAARGVSTWPASTDPTEYEDADFWSRATIGFSAAEV